MVWGYWVANWASNVAIITSFAGYLSLFFPIMKDTRLLFSIGSFNVEVGKLITFTICSILLWGTHVILTNGVSGAGKLNFLATTTKVTGFLLFIVVTLFAFEASKFGQWYTPMIDKSGVSHGLLSQVNLAALTTLWAFIGIESAVLYQTVLFLQNSKTCNSCWITYYSCDLLRNYNFNNGCTSR